MVPKWIAEVHSSQMSFTDWAFQGSFTALAAMHKAVGGIYCSRFCSPHSLSPVSPQEYSVLSDTTQEAVWNLLRLIKTLPETCTGGTKPSAIPIHTQIVLTSGQQHFANTLGKTAKMCILENRSPPPPLTVYYALLHDHLKIHRPAEFSWLPLPQFWIIKWFIPIDMVNGKQKIEN